jgi:hypothetical protein
MSNKTRLTTPGRQTDAREGAIEFPILVRAAI